MRARYQIRAAVNLANGSTLAGLGVAAAGRARLARAPDGLLTATGYRLPVPPAPAFTLGNVILTRRGLIPHNSALFRHEARHATQFAWCGGVLMLPMYFASAGASWMVCGNFGAWNVFERLAGLTDGGYPAWPPRPVIGRVADRASRRIGRINGWVRQVPGVRKPSAGPANAASLAMAGPRTD
ncbi:MAG: hypothetical protein J2P26_10905 [Nocardiopsaceae bacterium]|nr:hypothetical protein [Nocardiopsaceae bacterium]